MNIRRAMLLKIGQIVHYPADRGDPAGCRAISFIGSTVGKTPNGTEYIWVTLRGGGVWPSNRLG